MMLEDVRGICIKINFVLEVVVPWQRVKDLSPRRSPVTCIQYTRDKRNSNASNDLGRKARDKAHSQCHGNGLNSSNFHKLERSQRNENTNPLGLAKRCLLGDGFIVPVEDAEEADDADEESSSAEPC